MRSGLEGSCILLLQNQKWKQRKFLVFKEIFLERGEVFLEWISFHAIWSQLQHPVLVVVWQYKAFFSSSCSSLSSLRGCCCSTAEFIVGLTLKSLLACLTLQSALLSLLLCSVLTFVMLAALWVAYSSQQWMLQFLYRLHICTHKKELLLLLCERIFFFKVASRASTAFSTWQACDFSQRQTLQKRPSNKKEKRNKAVFCQNGEEDVLISFLHFHCGKMHHYLPCFSSLLLPWSFEFIMEFLWKWVDE